jgi:hypothetical protein
MADEQKSVNDILAGVAGAGVNWSEFKVEGTGILNNKQVTISVEVEELPKEES